MNMMICLECKGTGLVSYILNEEECYDADYRPIFDFKPCECCGGLGIVEVK